MFLSYWFTVNCSYYNGVYTVLEVHEFGLDSKNCLPLPSV